jgi:uncharacterized protein (TIGR02147 family)
MSAPKVFAYLDYRAFLTDWFKARKEAEPTYSYARFALDGGCSKAALANVIGGSRAPRSQTLDAFARAMSLQPTERLYLGHLVDLATAATQERRREVMERILATERFGQMRLAESEPDDAVAQYLEGWWIPAIRELAALPGFREDPEWLASQMVPPISTEQAQNALQTLIELEFLVRTNDGLVQREISFRTEPLAIQAAIANYNRVVLPSLLGTLDTSRSDEQHLLCATLTFDESVINEAKAKLNATMSQLVTMADDVPRQGHVCIS